MCTKKINLGYMGKGFLWILPTVRNWESWSSRFPSSPMEDSITMDGDDDDDDDESCILTNSFIHTPTSRRNRRYQCSGTSPWHINLILE